VEESAKLTLLPPWARHTFLLTKQVLASPERCFTILPTVEAIMKITEAIRLHEVLWSDDVPSRIAVGTKIAPVVIKNTDSKKFKMVDAEGLRFVTQNLGKPSQHTEWVKEAPDHHLTWVFQGDRYTGKIVSYKRDDGAEIIQAFSLNPERLIHETVEKDF
jgi:hypothetical protein